jgi:fructan beta-fructosidase
MAWQGENHGPTWTGNASFPVEQRLVSTPDGPRVYSEPVSEIRSLRRTTSTWGPTLIANELALPADESFDLEATFDLTETTTGSFTFRTGMHVTYDVASQQLNGRPLPPSPDGTLTLRLLVDRGQLAIFAGAYYECLNIEPCNDLRLTTDGPVKLTSLSLHHLNSIW